MIPFNKFPYTGNEEKYVIQAMKSNKICGDGEFTKKCQKWIENRFNCKKALLTPSCTHALEMSAILIDLKDGDEVIMPSYTFVSTANAFVLRGAKIVFVDIRQDTLNINEHLIEQSINTKTKAIVVVHYGGIAADMDKIIDIAKKYNIFVIEDAAQGFLASYKGKPLGTIGDIGAYSFHETKNYTSAGEGGAIIVNNPIFLERSEIIREKGTNRNQFIRGMIDKYSWVDIGSSYLLNDISAAYLWGQLQVADSINSYRITCWQKYYFGLKSLYEGGYLELPHVPDDCIHNGHMFYVKVKDINERTKLIDFLKLNDIQAAFHYIPLHSSLAGLKYGRFEGDDIFTTSESERILRLPLYYGLSDDEISKVIKAMKSFYK